MFRLTNKEKRIKYFCSSTVKMLELESIAADRSLVKARLHGKYTVNQIEYFSIL